MNKVHDEEIQPYGVTPFPILDDDADTTPDGTYLTPEERHGMSDSEKCLYRGDNSKWIKQLSVPI